MESISALKTVGLSEKESQVYLDLRRHGESKTGSICRRTKIPSSHIYGLLESLLANGLVSFKVVNNSKVFQASEPEALQLLFEEKEREIGKQKLDLMQFITQLKVAPSDPERFGDFRYYQGIRGIKSLYAQIMNAWKKGDEYIIASAPSASFQRLEGFFLETVHKKRIKDKVSLRMLTNQNTEKWGTIREKMPFTKVRYLPIDTQTEYGVLNEYFFLITYAQTPYGLLIKDQSFANTFRVFFDLLWKQAKE